MALLLRLLRPILSRLVGAALVAVSGYLARTVGVPLSDQVVQELTVAAVGLVIYLLTHRAVSAKLNPADIANPFRIDGER